MTNPDRLHWNRRRGGQTVSSKLWLQKRLATGTLTIRVADVLPLEQAAEAHRRTEAGGLPGRLVLAV
ncbi:zinc-binding dehydrogenase [Streptomyces sp. BA2]|uniref:zinc-binding dehydrogenase n=1 Tax=Streptomyces sp. BA2 TaxID=436595 RepID=UPI003014233F